MTYSSMLVSDVCSDSFQGQALGMLTSVQVFAEAVTGIGGGVLAGYSSSLPILIGGAMLLVASAFLFAFREKKVDTAS